MLKNEFVVGWANIIDKRYVGESHGYTCDEDSAVGTTNGAGPRNVQIFVMAPDLTVLQALPGFWHPQDLAAELTNAKRLLAVWNDDSLSLEEKRALATKAQLHLANHQSAETTARSSWQGFDAKNEIKRLENGRERDTFVTDGNGEVVVNERNDKPKMKPINRLVHERLADRPFVVFADFDVAAFTDYGRTYYDNNKKVDGAGEKFITPEMREKMERRAAQAAEQERRRQQQREQREQQAKRQQQQRERRQQLQQTDSK